MSGSVRVAVQDVNFIGALLQFDNGSTGFVINSWCSGRRVFRAKDREFIDAVKAGAQPGSCFADVLKTMEVAGIILAQSLLGEPPRA